MGKLIYGAQGAEFEFDDRLLAHLRIVIVTKLRRRESFTFTWDYPTSNGSGRMSLWVHDGLDLQFRFYGSREPQINRAWIEALSAVAASIVGLVPLPEPSANDNSTPAS